MPRRRHERREMRRGNGNGWRLGSVRIEPCVVRFAGVCVLIVR
jgi:hypothetical protein